MYVAMCCSVLQCVAVAVVDEETEEARQKPALPSLQHTS